MENMTFSITGLSPDGRGIAERFQGEPITFVAGALPGEQVSARILAEKKTFREAAATELLQPAASAVTPACPHAAECGGCPLMRMPYGEQCGWKSRFLSDALRRIGHFENAPVRPLIPSPETAGYRNKIEFAFGSDEQGRVCLGMRRRMNHAVTETPDCQLLDLPSVPILKSIQDRVRAGGLTSYVPMPAMPGQKRSRFRRLSGKVKDAGGHGFLRFCQLRTGVVPGQRETGLSFEDEGEKKIWVLFVTSPGTDHENAILRKIAQALLSDFPVIHAVIHEERKSADFLRQGDVRRFSLSRLGDIPEASRLLALLGDQTYLLDSSDFFQVNTKAAGILARLAGENLLDAPLLDLYCGVGAPGLSCIHGGSITGIEYSPNSVNCARINAKRMGVKAQYTAGDTANLFRRITRGTRFSQILCDPPRAGLAPEVVRGILELAPERIVYISCNPATLARDAALLAGKYDLVSATPVDLFPHTPHVESVALLTRSH